MKDSHFNGKLLINIENLINNLQRFNSENETNFSVNTSIEDVREFFEYEYSTLCSGDSVSQANPVEVFNDNFKFYAYMMK